ncbi:hypothetical protein PYW07_008357 [Mythimna separata]|uniref:Peptidase S1 domain-containing protein n=1 Tax=Mythimna separata TaxID=271217 RepID=A0AAD7YCJ7_MYTSE|nr:hypothetical protein PYW07_008357 [Mythimna separata]
MIVAVWSVVASLAASSVAQDSGAASLPPPCHSVFTHDPPGTEPGYWSAHATFTSDIPFDQVLVNVELDAPALEIYGKIERVMDNATSQDNTQFTMNGKGLGIMYVYVQYDPEKIIPMLWTVRLNEKAFCSAESLLSFDNSSSAAVNLDERVSSIAITMDECGVVAGGNVRFPLIYNGKFFKRGEIPWLVVIYRVNKRGVLERICGGTLISHLHILTAAHCVQLRSWHAVPMEEISVKIGVHGLNEHSDNLTITRKLVARYIHAEYDPYTLQNDILILTLDQSVEFNNVIRPACLWSGDTELSRVVGATGVVAGWGSRSVEDMRGQLDEPQVVRAPIVSNIECRGSKAVFHQVTYNTTLCAGYRNGTGPCSGDSGGGLYLLEGGKWTLRGVVSLALQNSRLTCDLNEYVVFTDTAKFLPWIRHILADKYIEPVHRYATSTTISDECGVGVASEILPLVHLGRSYERGEIPWLVAIFRTERQNLRFICAGTLVSDRHVITVANCKKIRSQQTEDKKMVVKLGVHDLEDWNDDIIVTSTVKRSTIHEGYDTTTFQNNIIVLTLNKRVTFNRYIRPACLWSGDTELSRVVGATGLIAGWGDREANKNENLIEEPQMVRMPIVSTLDCRASNPAFRHLTSNTTLCAGDRNGAAPCSGDSGSGLYLLKDSKWTLRGLVSVSLATEDHTCNTNEYAVFTDTAQYLPTVEKTKWRKNYAYFFLYQSENRGLCQEHCYMHVSFTSENHAGPRSRIDENGNNQKKSTKKQISHQLFTEEQNLSLQLHRQQPMFTGSFNVSYRTDCSRSHT